MLAHFPLYVSTEIFKKISQLVALPRLISQDRLYAIIFVSGLRRKALLYMNNGPRERFLRIHFPKKGVLVSPAACNKLQVGGLKR